MSEERIQEIKNRLRESDDRSGFIMIIIVHFGGRQYFKNTSIDVKQHSHSPNLRC